MKKRIKNLLVGLASIYVLTCIVIYFQQERLLFHASPLPRDYKFKFEQPFEELTIVSHDGIRLHGLLFKADSTNKDLIFYLHGNAGNTQSWGKLASIYTQRNHDVFFLDYRGFGKSEGNINSEEQLLYDVQIALDKLKQTYSEKNITLLGYSIGTGPASFLASKNEVKQLILQAPYLSLQDLTNHIIPLLPSQLLRYPMRTDRYLQACKIPIYIFHGTNDRTIYYQSSEKLKAISPEKINLISLANQGHNDISHNPKYLSVLDSILKN